MKGLVLGSKRGEWWEVSLKRMQEGEEDSTHGGASPGQEDSQPRADREGPGLWCLGLAIAWAPTGAGIA